MLISKQWLSEFVSIPKDCSDKELALLLSLSTVEVEGIRFCQIGEWDHIVVGRIEELKAHPNADRLKIAMTRVSKKGEPICIVCGGSNLKEGMSVIVALPLSRIRWHGQGEPVMLEKTAIRGVESNGMICASSEVGLAEQFPAADEHEIVDLTSLDVQPGTSLADALSSQDAIFDIDNKSLSNRPDLWGHRGMAREVAAVLDGQFNDRKLPSIPIASRIPISVSIDDAGLCGRYACVVVEGISIQPSPVWMQQRLRACGVRPINTIVDITNYVMLEWGQPMHAFDYHAIKEKDGSVKLRIRNAKKGELFAALDEKEYALDEHTLLVANARNPLAIAGVMGGLASSITSATSAIVFESAHFNAHAIRKTSSSLKLMSESSRRFEKHLDPEQALSALQRAVELCLEICPEASTASKVCDTYPKKDKKTSLSLTGSVIASKLGISIPLPKAKRILESLGFGITQQSASSLRVSIPSFRRKDVAIAEDVIEEVARLYGYAHIPSRLPSVQSRIPRKNAGSAFIRELKYRLALQYRMHESHNYAFVKPSTLEACHMKVDDHLKLSNPFSDERPFVCRSLVPNLLETIEKNQNEHKRIMLFEIAPVFYDTDFFQQPLKLACVFSDPQEKNLFSYARNLIASCYAEFGYALTFQKPSASEGWWKKDSAAFISAGGASSVGMIAIVDSSVCEKLGIDREVVACELDLSLLHVCERKERMYVNPPLYPSVHRDINCVVDEAVSYESLHAALQVANELIESVEPFDIYRGLQIERGKKSISFHIGYRSNERTLTSQEADKAHIEVAALLEKKFNATIR